MRTPTLATLALLLAPFAGAQRVHVNTGDLRGVAAKEPGVNVFYGIPYAAPPVGELRWRAPQPPAPWKGVRSAEKPGNSCIQHMNGPRLPWTAEWLATPPMSEDCLYLNIWTPAAKPKEPLPVLVWVHGGGFTQGSGAAQMVNGDHIAARGVVFITINYRLGTFGFFAHPELSAESGHHASGNYGLMDMVAALQWVRANVAAFGGDPSKVTIAGQSSGASAMEFLSVMPSAHGLFRGAIIESGAQLKGPSALPLAEQEKMGVALGVETKAATIAQLRALPADTVFRMAGHLHLKFTPDIDGWVVPSATPAVYAAGKQNDVPTINGIVAEEASSHPDYGKQTPAQVTEQIRSMFKDHADEALKLYPTSTQAEATVSQKQLDHDRRLVSAYLWGAARSVTAKTPLYSYVFTHAIPWPEHPEFGVFHCTEMAYWMRNLDRLPRPWNDADRKLQDEISGYWLNFIKTGSPNGQGLPQWPTLKVSQPVVMELGDRLGPMPLVSPEKYALWLRYFHRTETSEE